MIRRRDGRGARLGLGMAVVLGGILATATGARAHEDPPGCFETGPAIIITVFRADGVTGLVGPVSQCEPINYRATLKKASDVDSVCAFSGGVFSLTTPDGVVHNISLNVPCIGGTTAPCDPTVDQIQSALIPYTVKPADIVAGFINASANYVNGVAHDNDPDSTGVSAMSPKANATVLCTDNNLCTTDVCDPTKQGSAACSFPPVVCTDNNLCTTDTCNPATGLCQFPNAVTCTDNNLCTTDICNPASGLCEFPNAVTCTDNNLCTTDICNPASGLCEFPNAVTCTDNNLCTNDVCNPATGGCEFPSTGIVCTDNNLCTTEACNPATGQCANTGTTTCTDNNLCTNDVCNPATGQCEFPPTGIVCTDNNLCTTEACNPATGQCANTSTTTCTDNNLCTNDVCDPATGACTFPTSVVCTDNNLCTNDICNPATGGCEFPSTGIVCTDNNICTTEACNPATGQCAPTGSPTDCNDNNLCTNDVCNPATGCVHTNIVCVDNNLCTSDACIPASGCSFTDTSPNCNDNNPCTDDACVPAQGCVNTPNQNPQCQGLNHFQCYEIKPFAFPRIASVSVQDRYGSVSLPVRTPHPFCLPSDKKGEDPAAATDPEHLMGFADPAGPVKVPNQTVTNQFGTVKVDLVRRTYLMVPTAKSLAGPTPALPVPTVTDHFQCYLVKRSLGAARFTPQKGVAATDQFGSHSVDLLRPRYLCVPANKNNEDPTAPQHPQSLLCYKTRHRSRFGTERVFTNNQFGPLQATITRRLEFCVPSTVGPVGD